MGDSAFDRDKQLDGVLQQVAGQMKLSLGNIYSALERLAPPEKRDGDPQLDMDAAVLCQSYFRVMRLANNLADAAGEETDIAVLRNDDIVELCRNVMEKAAHAAHPLELEVEFRCEKNSHIIAMNAQRIERMLLNLLSNAFKFTPKGGKVTLEVRIGLQQVELRLTDTGCGIEPERLDTVFDRYRQIGRMEAQPHGLGLGLPICQRIVQQHGGRIALTSRVGEGTTVVVSLPNKKSRVQQLGTFVVDYAGGYDHTLLELADALPRTAFLQKYLD